MLICFLVLAGLMQIFRIKQWQSELSQQTVAGTHSFLRYYAFH